MMLIHIRGKLHLFRRNSAFSYQGRSSSLETFERGLAGGSRRTRRRPEESKKYEKYGFRKGLRGI
jgi:hypothetical protein